MGLKCFSNTAIFKDHVFAKRLSKKENRLHERPKNAHTRTEFKDSLCYRFIQIEEIFWKEIPRKKKKMQFTETETIQCQIRALFTICNIRYRDWRQGASPNKNPASSTFSLVPAHHQDKTRL